MNKLDLAKTTTDPVILDELSRDEGWEVRCWVARNPNTSPEILDYLSGDKDSDVRGWVAQHPNTSLETLKQMFIFETESGCDDTVKVCIVDNSKFIDMIKELSPCASS